MDILLLLLRRPGELVTRADITEAIWPGSSADDVTYRINTAITRIRRALGEDPERARYIETVIGRGYRFIAPVEVETPDGPDTEPRDAPPAVPEAPSSLEESTASSPSPDVLPQPSGSSSQEGFQRSPASTLIASARAGKSRPAAWLWLAAALLLVTSAALGIRRLRASPSSARRLFADLAKWTTSTNDNPLDVIAISPDGQMLVFTNADGLFIEGRRDLAPKPLPPLDLREIDRLSWFPDGKHVAVSGIAKQIDTPRVWKIAVDGTSGPSLFGDGIRAATISSAESRVAYLRKDDSEVWEANLDGSSARLLRTADAGTVFDQVLWAFGKPVLLVEEVRLPSQKEAVANTNAFSSPAESTLMTLNSRSGAVTASAHGFKVREGCSLPGDRVMLEGLDEHHRSMHLSAHFSPDSPGLFDTPPAPLPPPDNSILKSCSVAASTGDTAFLLQKGQAAVFVGELTNGDRQLLHPHPITSAEFISYPHAWSASGDSVLYEQYHEKWYLFEQPIDRHDPRPLAQPQIEGVGARLSPDGRWVLFFRKKRDGSMGLFRMPAKEQRGEPEELAVPAYDLRCPRVGAECIVRTKDAAAHAVGLYALNPATVTMRFLRSLPWEEASLTDWDVSPDGISIVLCGSVTTEGVLRIVNLRGQEERTEIFPVDGSFHAINWSTSGKGWFGVTYTKAGADLYFLDPAHTATLLRTTAAHTTWGVPSPDGRALAFVDLNQERNLWIAHQLR
jgi:DNA-binding winged helix-turn-helix (wHTH) protein/WD40 repeat protein